mmetsp:Transcript_54247/g.156806  ORF Transcript_54247/g.156806 Transcript_54247/m.156806 type:complete len:252 (-) Transcript_54247:605-1360(-)
MDKSELAGEVRHVPTGGVDRRPSAGPPLPPGLGDRDETPREELPLPLSAEHAARSLRPSVHPEVRRTTGSWARTVLAQADDGAVAEAALHRRIVGVAALGRGRGVDASGGRSLPAARRRGGPHGVDGLGDPVPKHVFLGSHGLRRSGLDLLRGVAAGLRRRVVPRVLSHVHAKLVGAVPLEDARVWNPRQVQEPDHQQLRLGLRLRPTCRGATAASSGGAAGAAARLPRHHGQSRLRSDGRGSKRRATSQR